MTRDDSLHRLRRATTHGCASTEADHEHHRPGVAAGRPVRRGQDGHLQGQRHLRAHVLPGDARRVQRAADAARRRPDRLRQRLPRRHLRDVRAGDQRRGPRPAADHDLPVAHALVQGRRRDRHRAVAGRRLPGGQGPGGRPGRVRPDHPGRRLHLGPDRHRARRARRAGAQDRRRPRVRRRHLHRLWRLRRRLPQRLGDAVHRGQGHPPRACCRRASPSATPGCRAWSPSTTRRASAAAPTSASAPRSAPRASRWTPSPGSTGTCSALSPAAGPTGPERLQSGKRVWRKKLGELLAPCGGSRGSSPIAHRGESRIQTVRTISSAAAEPSSAPP